MTEYKFTSPDKTKSVLELLTERGANIQSPCGGHGICGKCRVKIEGSVSPLTETEREALTGNEIEDGIRLACLTYPEGDFSAYCDGGGDIDVVTDSVSGVSSDGNPITDGLCVGIDIGTTTVAVYLCSGADGKVIKVSSFANPQAKYGADVISRLSYIREKNGLSALHDEIAGRIDDELKSFGGDIKYISIAGNTVMEHIMAGYDPSGIAVAPFIPASLFGLTLKAGDIGLTACPEAPVYFMPCAASYVGGDIISGLCASGVDTQDETALYLDIGTNGELALSHNGKIITAAAAAGPAFEGAGIECGCPGITGAISDITIDGGSVSYETIGGASPVGICGSALIKLTALLLDEETVEDTGYMEDNFDITPDGAVYLSPKDVRQVQLAKAAIAAGLYTLLDSEGIGIDDVDKVYIAGGFGAHIDIHSACRIGLIPADLEDVTLAVGNAAGAGACSWLLDSSFRERIEALGQNAGYIELSGDARFSNHYMEQMIFGE